VLAGGTRAGHMLAIGDVMVFVMFLLSLLRGGANELGITNIAHIAHMLFRSCNFKKGACCKLAYP